MGEFLRTIWDILGAILLLFIVIILGWLIHLYISSKRSEKPKKIYVTPDRREEAARKQKQFEEQMAYLRKNDPEKAKKVWRWHILSSLLAVAFLIGICLLVNFLRQK